MENQFKTRRAALTIVAPLVLVACAAPPAPKTASAPLAPIQLSIAQEGFGPTARFVYCEPGSCPAPTSKTLAVAAAAPVARVNAKVFEGRTRWQSVDIAFPFNSAVISEADQKQLTEAASQYAGGRIEISARSDFVGPPEGQKKVVAARAKAMRSIVAKLAQGAQISERREVAGPLRVSEVEQVQQRKGTVRFTPPADVQLKGSQP